MSEQNYTPKKYVDFISSFESGINSGIAPTLLNKNQLAFAVNTSVRGGFCHPRPPFQLQSLLYNGSSLLQSLVENGLYQGGGFYRPDYGTESLIASISGRIFKFTESGSSWLVTDISIANDLNSATAYQVWMWQAEKWLIIQDGTGALPIFFDGVICRRSHGPSKQLGTTAAAITPPNPRVIGETIATQLTSQFAGDFGVPVIFNGEYYQTANSVDGYSVVLTNANAIPANTIPIGTSIIVNQATIGMLTAQVSLHSIGCYAQPSDSMMIDISADFTGSIGDVIIVDDFFTVTDILNSRKLAVSPTYQINLNCSGSKRYSVGTYVTRATSQPNFLIGNTVASFVVPPVGETVTVSIDRNYTELITQFVFIGTDGYTITPPLSSATSATLYLINLSDTSIAQIPAGSTIQYVPELPAGRMGAYGMGCNCMSLTDGISYVVSDVVGSGAGSPASNYRDAVLKMTQNTFLSGGGSFRIPGTGEIITAIFFPPNLDTSLGQGALQISTPYTIFSNVTPGTDPAGWTSLTTPIQTESLKGKGCTGQNSTVIVNSDTFFRSYDGFGTLVLARRDFQNWGNKTISSEVVRPLESDDQALLQYGFAESFDNRFIGSTYPEATKSGISHRGLVALDFDLISTLRGNQPPAWEGLWTGVNALQTIQGTFSGDLRQMIFTANKTTGKIELYELLTEKSSQSADNGGTPIEWSFETPVLFNKDIKAVSDLVRLRDGEVYLSDIIGSVSVKVFYRPDFYPCWTLWNEFTVCQSADAANSQSGYRMRIGLGEPDSLPVEIGNNQPLRVGYFFQFRFEVTGHCTVNGMRASAIAEPAATFALVEIDASPCQVISCNLPDDFAYKLQV